MRSALAAALFLCLLVGAQAADVIRWAATRRSEGL